VGGVVGLVTVCAGLLVTSLPASAATAHADASILTGAFPSSSAAAAPGDTVGALYQAGTALNTAPGFQVIFTIDGSPVPFTTAPGPKGAQRYSTLITSHLPAVAAGAHRVYLKAWDSSQQSKGGNWGEVAWMVNVPSAPAAAGPSSTPAPYSASSAPVAGPITQPTNAAASADTTFTQSAKAKGNPGTGCSEDSFLGSAFPAAGATVKPGDLVGANYQDESPLNTNPGFEVIFTLDGVAVPYTTAPGPKGKEKYSTLIEFQLPATVAGGTHTVFLKAWDGDQNKAGGDCGEATWTFNVVTPERGIVVEKSGAALAHEGDSVTYTFKVTNTGKADLFNVAVDDDVLGHIGDIASLPVGTSQTLTKAYTVPVGKKDIVNTVTACGRDASKVEVCDTDNHKLHPIHPAIAIVKTANPVSVNPGQSVTYTYKVTNTGDVDLTNVTVDDDILGHIGTLPSLAVGATQTLTKAVTIQANSPTRNVATAVGTDPLGTKVSAQDDAVITVVLGELIQRPLPRTGLALGLMAFAALALISVGGVLIKLRRRLESEAN
jgi:hypothetical protein